MERSPPPFFKQGLSANARLLFFSLLAIGLLVVDSQKQEPRITFLPYSSALPEGKATTLRGAKSLRYFIGNYGPEAIILANNLQSPYTVEAGQELRIP